MTSGWGHTLWPRVNHGLTLCNLPLLLYLGVCVCVCLCVCECVCTPSMWPNDLSVMKMRAKLLKRCLSFSRQWSNALPLIKQLWLRLIRRTTTTMQINNNGCFLAFFFCSLSLSLLSKDSCVLSQSASFSPFLLLFCLYPPYFLFFSLPASEEAQDLLRLPAENPLRMGTTSIESGRRSEWRWRPPASHLRLQVIRKIRLGWGWRSGQEEEEEEEGEEGDRITWRINGHWWSGQNGGILDDDRRCRMRVMSVIIQQRRIGAVADVLHWSAVLFASFHDVATLFAYFLSILNRFSWLWTPAHTYTPRNTHAHTGTHSSTWFLLLLLLLLLLVSPSPSFLFLFFVRLKNWFTFEISCERERGREGNGRSACVSAIFGRVVQHSSGLLTHIALWIRCRGAQKWRRRPHRRPQVQRPTRQERQKRR